jgi:hypothetical protein
MVVPILHPLASGSHRASSLSRFLGYYPDRSGGSLLMFYISAVRAAFACHRQVTSLKPI